MRFPLFLGLAILVAATGCSHKTTVTSTDGTTTVSTSNNGQTATITTKEGSATYGAGAVDTSKLGAPVYPGATAAEGGGMSASTTTGSSAMGAFSTADSFDAVYGWYKAHMPPGSEKMKMSSGGSDVAEFVAGKDADAVAVMISDKDGKTQIVITHNTKK